jgi:hypothetical protein
MQTFFFCKCYCNYLCKHEDMYGDVLRNFNRLIPHVLTDVTFIPAYGMTDCEPAER